ncbi:MAG TPA: YaiI/YqxD family protein [Beijerinckiaceae bacterium]|jgi:uncharacterized protein YaiI (UPF0178 family)
MTTLYIDADACPVKDEVYRVAERYGVRVFVVSNSWMRVPKETGITFILVDGGPDAADNWIAERAGAGDVVVTADTPLADRAIKAGAQALHPAGRAFTADSIGGALASRAIGEHLRSVGETTRGPKPFTAADRSRFLQALDAAVVRARRHKTSSSETT